MTGMSWLDKYAYAGAWGIEHEEKRAVVSFCVCGMKTLQERETTYQGLRADKSTWGSKRRV